MVDWQSLDYSLFLNLEVISKSIIMIDRSGSLGCINAFRFTKWFVSRNFQKSPPATAAAIVISPIIPFSHVLSSRISGPLCVKSFFWNSESHLIFSLILPKFYKQRVMQNANQFFSTKLQGRKKLFFMSVPCCYSIFSKGLDIKIASNAHVQ